VRSPRTSKSASSRSGGIFDLDQARARLSELDEISADPDFWNEPEKAQELMRERTDVFELVRKLDEPTRAIEDTLLLLELAEEEGDDSLLADGATALADARTAIEGLEFNRMLGGPADRVGAILHINSGAGGLESQDWAQMLLRMYLRWCDSQGYKVSMVDEVEGDEAGIKSATVEVVGEYAYGRLKAEAGVHRLVRISPFDASARRHTSFASVFVYPDIEDEITVEVNEADLRIDTYRASGAGGQHVNKTESAVRITHLPTNIVVQCQNERSQHKNRAVAMKLLRSRLYALELEKREKELDQVYADKKEIGFGSQIRSYVLQPYRMVKDHRTGCESSNTDAVLDGALDEFIKAYLLMQGNRESAGRSGASA
jgi:peptide chain release factor 2